MKSESLCSSLSTGLVTGFKYNVIAVDWGKIAMDMIYPTARYHVEGVGQYVGQLLSTLYNSSLIRADKLHLIGHSLGAHVAGNAGKAVQKDGWTIARITGKNPSILLITLSQPQLCVLGLLVPFRTMLCLVKYTMVRIGKTHQLYHAVQSVFSNKTMVPMVFVLRSTR